MKECQFQSLRYLVRFPKDYRKGERRPVILALHGAGYRGEDLNVLRQNPFFTCTQELSDFPFVLVAPQCHTNTWFDVFETLIAFVDHILGEDYTDPARLSVMGASMGGFATWQLGMSVPEKFCALIPICGGGMDWNAPRLVNVPVRAFHGEIDTIVSPMESEKMVRALQNAGGDATLTVYPETAHNAWSATYSDQALFCWLKEQKNRAADLKSDGFVGDDFG